MDKTGAIPVAHLLQTHLNPWVNQKHVWSELESVPTLNEPNLIEKIRQNQSGRSLTHTPGSSMGASDSVVVLS